MSEAPVPRPPWTLPPIPAVLLAVISVQLEMMALRVLSSRAFGILMSLEPAAAALSGLVFLREQLIGAQWLVLALVSIASAGAALTARRVPPPVEA